MCGIAGIIFRTPETSISHRIQKMCTALAHRGPDGDGFLLMNDGVSQPYSGTIKAKYKLALPYLPQQEISSQPSAQLALGHRRLSIIDLSETGHQPMCDLEQRCWITYNGEIYNYKELRSELLSKGHTFQSQSDTEVILHAYLEWGTDCVQRFNGMWSFCLYDSFKNLCFLSRDRAGVKPLYYCCTNNHFAFASEQKALIASGLIAARANSTAVHNYLMTAQIDQGDVSFFEGIEELSPGHNLVFNLNQSSYDSQPYYHFSFAENKQDDYETLIDKTRGAVDSAIRFRLRSDVPVGTCLSGGIDSSILLSSMSTMAKESIHAFTASFPGKPIDETSFANIVATKTHAIHHLTIPTVEDFLQQVDAIVYAQDTPIWDTSTFAQHAVMKLAQTNGIKVVLDGQGADELFGGYHHHYLTYWRESFRENGWLSTLKQISAAGKTIPSPFFFFIKETYKPRNFLSQQKGVSLLTNDYLKIDVTSLNYARSLNLQLVEDIRKNRLRPFLKCEDRASMHASVESRTPFSDDPELLALALSIPGKYKIKNGVSKSILRDAYKDLLPEQIYTRYDKKGFETPSSDWYALLRSTMITSIRSANLPMVDSNKLDHYSGQNDKLLFRLFIYSRWLQVFSTFR